MENKYFRLASALALWQNSPMSPQRWIFFILSIMAGFGLGLLYGWVINPIEYINTSPDTLRADYRADYVLMVAEIYHAEQDVEQAIRRLSLLGSALSPLEIVSQALQFAQTTGYAQQDILLLQNLSVALQMRGGNEAVP